MFSCSYFEFTSIKNPPAACIDPLNSKLGKIALPDNIWSTAMSMRSEARQSLGGSGAGGHGGGGHNLRSSGRSAGYGVGGASEGVVGGSSRIAGRNKFKKSYVCPRELHGMAAHVLPRIEPDRIF